MLRRFGATVCLKFYLHGGRFYIVEAHFVHLGFLLLALAGDYFQPNVRFVHRFQLTFQHGAIL
jgi:hypothetical protein